MSLCAVAVTLRQPKNSQLYSADVPAPALYDVISTHCLNDNSISDVRGIMLQFLTVLRVREGDYLRHVNEAKLK